MGLRIPGPENRIAILGSTGSGKSTAGLFHLSRAPFDEMPYTIVDSKREPEIAAINAERLSLADRPPTKPGLYVLNIRPGDKTEREIIEIYFDRMHQQGNHGLFLDEGYSVYPVRSRGALTNIFTQGRSLRLPVIFNSQRPSGVGVEALSEATFYQVFDLWRPDDRKKAQEYLPDVDIVSEPIGLYKSIYRDQPLNVTQRIGPVRPAGDSVAAINRRLAAIRAKEDEVRQLDAVQEPKMRGSLRLV